MCDNCNCKKEDIDLAEAISELIDVAIDVKLSEWKVSLIEYFDKKYEKKYDRSIERVI